MFLPCWLFGQALEPTGSWVGKWWLPGRLVPMRTHQNCCCQCLCPHSEPQPPPASAGNPPILAGSLAQSLKRSLLFSWVLVCTRLWVHPARVEFLLPPVLRNSCNQTSVTFKARNSGAPPPIARLPSWKA